MDIPLYTLILSGILLLWTLLIYPVFMGIIGLIKDPPHKDYSYIPKFSIIVPAYNEEKTILKRIKNLEKLNYPKDRYEIIIVESGSTDNTYQLVKNYIASRGSNLPKITLIHEDERKGKAHAINLGKKYAKGDIIVVTDANTLFHPDVLREIGPYFKDKEVGAVDGRHVVLGNSKYEHGEGFRQEWECLMRLGESLIDSACLVSGELNAWRKELITLNPNSISDDLDISLQVISKKKKIKYEPRATYYERTPSNREELIKQRRRTTVGTIQATRLYWRTLFPPKNIYTMLIYPSHRILQILSPFILIIFVISTIFSFWTNFKLAFFILLLYGAIGMVLWSILKYLVHKIKIKYKLYNFEVTDYRIINQKTQKNPLKHILDMLSHFILIQYSILLAWLDYLKGRYSVKWEKVESTREL